MPAGDWDSLLAYLDVLVLYAKSREAELRKKADLKASRAFGEEMTQFARMILKVRGHYIPSWIFDLTEAAFRALGRRV